MHGVAKLQIEFKRQDSSGLTGMYPVNVLDVSPGGGPSGEPPGILLRFEEGWQQDGWYPIEQEGLFEPPPRHSAEELANRLKTPCAVEAPYKIKQGCPSAWYRGQLISENKGLYTIDLQLNPPRKIHQPMEHLRLIHEPVPLTKDSIQRLVFNIPEDLTAEATNDDQLGMIARFGRFEHVQHDPVNKCVIILVFGQEGAHRAQILFEAHIRYAVTRRDLKNNIAKMRLEVKPPEDESNSYKVDFSVPVERLRHSVGGPEHRNLVRARALSGITRIVLDDRGHYVIVAKDENAMKEAREILDIGTEIIYVDQPLVRHLIGRKGDNIKQIMGMTGVFTLGIHDTAESFNKANVQSEWREGFAAFVVVGTRAEVDAARMLIEYQLDHNRQLEDAFSSQRRSGRPPALSRQGTEDRGSEGSGAQTGASNVRPQENGTIGGPSQNNGQSARPSVTNQRVPGGGSGTAGPVPNEQRERTPQSAGPRNNQEGGGYSRRDSGPNSHPADQNQNYRGNNSGRGGPRRSGPGGNRGGYQGNFRNGTDAGRRDSREDVNNGPQQQNPALASSSRENGFREDHPDEGFTQAGGRKKKSGRNRGGQGAPRDAARTGDQSANVQ